MLTEAEKKVGYTRYERLTDYVPEKDVGAHVKTDIIPSSE